MLVQMRAHRSDDCHWGAQVALDSDDTEFMVHPLVAVFTLYTWHGSAFLAQTSCSDPRSTSLLSPYMGWR